MSEVVLHVTTVDLGGGVCLDLEIFEGDDPREKAIAFAQRFGLAGAVADALAEHVEREALEAAAATAATIDDAITPPLPSAPATTPRPPAHERLYARAAEARERLETQRRREAEAERERRSALASTAHTNWISAALTRDRGRGGGGDDNDSDGINRRRPTSYGEMLYLEGLASLERRQRLAATALEAREQAELAECRPRPMHSSAQTKRKDSSTASTTTTFASWSERAAAREARLEELRRQRDAAAMAECTFAPRTNSNNNSHNNTTERGVITLYEDAAQRRARQLEREQAEERARATRTLRRPRSACEATGAHLHALAAERAWRALRAAEAEEQRRLEAAAAPKIDPRGQQLAAARRRDGFGGGA